MKYPAVVVVSSLALLAACSRQTPPAPSPPVAKEDRAPRAPDTAAKEKAPSLLLAAKVSEPDAGVETAPPPPAPPPPSLDGKVVLHAGDSMVGGSWGLTRALESKFKAEGAKFFHETKVSETIASFDKADRMKELVERYHPDIVLLTLGTNEALVPYPQSLAHHVRNIAREIGSRECYWIGPPLWKPDTGILAVIRDNAGPCKFYDSSPLKLQRGSDGIHPTDKGGQDWADHFWTYFRTPVAPDAGP